jgi:hypothetical protein
MAVEYENTIKKMFDAWTRLSADKILDFFANDAVFCSSRAGYWKSGDSLNQSTSC